MNVEELRQQAEEFNEYAETTKPRTSQDVGAFFDRNHDVLVAIYHGNLHPGYWPRPHETDDFPAAGTRFSDVVIKRLGVGPGDRVLDVGCGVGGPALRLAEITGAEVVGISVSERDVAAATANAVAAGQADRVRFQLADAMDPPFDAGSFDAVMALGSMSFMPDRPRVLRRIARMVHPEGRVVLTDEVLLKPDREETEEQVYARHIVASAWHNTLPARIDEYAEMCWLSGLQVEELLDVTDQVKYTYGHLYRGLAAYRDEHDLPPDMAEILALGADTDWEEFQKEEQTDGVVVVVARRRTG